MRSIGYAYGYENHFGFPYHSTIYNHWSAQGKHDIEICLHCHNGGLYSMRDVDDRLDSRRGFGSYYEMQ